MTTEESDSTVQPAPAGPGQPVLVFRVGTLLLALPASTVEAVEEMQEPSWVPMSPPHILGMVNRGERAIAVVDLARFLGLGVEAASAEGASGGGTRRVIVASAEGIRAGLLCDRALGLTEPAAMAHRPPQVLQGSVLRKYLRSEFEGPHGVVGVLDTSALLDAARVKA